MGDVTLPLKPGSSLTTECNESLCPEFRCSVGLDELRAPLVFRLMGVLPHFLALPRHSGWTDSPVPLPQRRSLQNEFKEEHMTKHTTHHASRLPECPRLLPLHQAGHSIRGK